MKFRKTAPSATGTPPRLAVGVADWLEVDAAYVVRYLHVASSLMTDAARAMDRALG